MNKKEINEIRRQLTPDRGLKKIYGCYVNTNKEIISYIEESLALMPEFEAQKFSSLLKKCLSGVLGKNLQEREIVRRKEGGGPPSGPPPHLNVTIIPDNRSYTPIHRRHTPICRSRRTGPPNIV